jgi:hypothetical protein
MTFALSLFAFAVVTTSALAWLAWVSATDRQPKRQPAKVTAIQVTRANPRTKTSAATLKGQP